MQINSDSGTAALVLGTATVLTSYVTSNSKITLSTAGTQTIGSWRVSAIVSGVSFTITSSNPTDNSKVAWEIS